MKFFGLFAYLFLCFSTLSRLLISWINGLIQSPLPIFKAAEMSCSWYLFNNALIAITHWAALLCLAHYGPHTTSHRQPRPGEEAPTKAELWADWLGASIFKVPGVPKNNSPWFMAVLPLLRVLISLFMQIIPDCMLLYVCCCAVQYCSTAVLQHPTHSNQGQFSK